MKIIAEAEIDFVKKQLETTALWQLSLREICIYTLYRISKLVSSAIAVSNPYEIKYNLCEVGPGKRRLDPWALSIITDSAFFQKISHLGSTKENGFQFLFDQSIPSELTKEIIQYKNKHLQSRLHDLSSHESLTTLQRIITPAIPALGFQVSESRISNSYLDCLVVSNAAPNQRFLIRFLLGLDWIYPSDINIWNLYVKSNENDCLPVLIAPHIHGTCFPIFKAIGLFARQTYYNITPKISPMDLKGVSNDLVKKALKSFSIGQFIPAKDFGLDILEFLLTNTFPSHFHAFHSKQKLISERLLPLFKSALTLSDDVEINKKIDRVEKLLKEAKLRGVANVKTTLDRYKKMVSELNN